MKLIWTCDSMDGLGEWGFMKGGNALAHVGPDEKDRGVLLAIVVRSFNFQKPAASKRFALTEFERAKAWVEDEVEFALLDALA